MKASRLLSLFQVAILLFLLCACSNETTNSNAQNGFDYEYSNAKGQSFSFHCSNSNVTVYEKTVNDLISEWNSNVALAEKTYNRNDVLILTEGYIQNINKGSRDSYYMLLSQDEDSGLFATEELRVYFNDKTLDSLMKLKKGNYVTLLCTAQDTTFFLEYPELAVDLILEPLQAANTSEGLSSMIGLTVSDIISQYGTDYEIECWEGGMAFFYEDCPYIFYYSTVEYDRDWQPNLDDKIFRIETFSEGTKVFQEIDIGCSLDVIETFLGFKLEFDEDPANDGITDIYLDGFKCTLCFDENSDVLVSASCWTDFVPPEYPDIVPENLDLLTFNSYGSVDYTKMAFILCVIQDDIRAYRSGLESAYDWNIDFDASDFNWDNYWLNLMDDLNNYLNGKQSEYEDAWKMGENAFYTFAAGIPDSDELFLMANIINNTYSSLGNLK